MYIPNRVVEKRRIFSSGTDIDQIILENHNPSNHSGKRVMRLWVFDMPVCRIGFVDDIPGNYFLGSD